MSPSDDQPPDEPNLLSLLEFATRLIDGADYSDSANITNLESLRSLRTSNAFRIHDAHSELEELSPEGLPRDGEAAS